MASWSPVARRASVGCRQADADRLAWLRHRRGNGRDCTPASRGVFAPSLLLAPAPQGISGHARALFRRRGAAPAHGPNHPSVQRTRVRCGWGSGAPSRIRTCDLRIRSPTLYPTELWARPAAPGEWRRGRDSNPGPGSTPGNRLAGGCLRPTRPPLRAQRPHHLGGYNLCQLSGRPWDEWRRGRDSNPRGLAPVPVFKSSPGGHPCRPLPTNPKRFLLIAYYAFGAVWGTPAGVPAQNPAGSAQRLEAAARQRTTGWQRGNSRT